MHRCYTYPSTCQIMAHHLHFSSALAHSRFTIFYDFSENEACSKKFTAPFRCIFTYKLYSINSGTLVILFNVPSHGLPFLLVRSNSFLFYEPSTPIFSKTMPRTKKCCSSFPTYFYTQTELCLITSILLYL